MSVLYILMLQFALFQNFRDIKDVLKWLDPQGLSKEKLDEKVSFPLFQILLKLVKILF